MIKPLKLIRTSRQNRADSIALTIENLHMVFHSDSGYLNVLDNISFTVDTGELVCILGPSGCGKTTLLKLVAGFMQPGSGHIKLGDRAVTRPGPDRCVVFQEDALFPWLTVAENIAFGARQFLPRKQLAAEVDLHLEMVGLSAFRDYLPKDISGGMKQRVALARVLILKPRVLLMDEPFGALDAQTREEMQQLLLSLWNEFGHTILFVTHDLSEAVTLADRIIFLDHTPGRIRKTAAVPLPRPRKKESEQFHHVYRDLRNFI